MDDDTPTVEGLRASVHELDPALTDEADETFRVAVLLLASAHVGTNPFVLATLTEEHVEWVALITNRFKDNGIFTEDGHVAGGGWLDEETGGIEFWMDVAVGRGFLERAGN